VGYQHEFSVEFTRLDEQMTVAYQVICPKADDDALAISKAEAQFATEHPDYTLVDHEDIVNPTKRARMAKASTFWRNKVFASNVVLV
jgi:hypothetical protein